MKIYSSDKRSWIELVKSEDGYAEGVMQIGCEVDLNHGSFSALNSDVCVLNLGEFISSVDAFVTDRRISPCLKGSYDTEIRLSCPKNPLVVVLSFSIGDAYAGYSEPVNYTLAGAFEISQETLIEVLGELRSLA